jgi:hypothetical protein
MAKITSLTDPLIKSVVAHVFNKFRADVEGKDGEMVPSKSKFRQTSNQLLSQYNIVMDPVWLKNKKVAPHTQTNKA